MATTVDQMLDKVEKALEQDLLPVGIFNDPAIYEAEIDRIFMRNWTFVAHESEIPNKNDFVLRRIGRDSVIVTRDADNKINVMSNHCRHRGSEVCQADRGNAAHFKCPYHGWSYRNNGDWAGAPHVLEAYGGRLDKKEWGLLHAPHVDVHQGLIFASLDRNAPPLKEHLGGMGWLLDAFFGLAPGGMRVAAPPERTRVRANWKSAAENFSGDEYHVDHLHWSIQLADAVKGLESGWKFACTYELGDGHNAIGHEWVKAIHPGWLFGGYPENYIQQFDLSQLDPTQLQMMRDKPPTVGTVFPNLSFVRAAVFLQMDKPPAVMTSLRQWQPISPDEIELWSWQLVWNFESEAEVKHTYDLAQFSFGSAGIFEQDDTAAWEGIAKVGASPWWRREGLNFHMQQKAGKNVNHSPDPDWKGPGIHRMTAFGEHPQLAFYRQWLKVMRQGGKD